MEGNIIDTSGAAAIGCLRIEGVNPWAISVAVIDCIVDRFGFGLRTFKH